MMNSLIKKTFLAAAILLLFGGISNAQSGGMWIPSLIKDLNIKDMQKMGLKLSSEDLYSINKSSIKDAIGHFGGGCTAELISAQGLLLTNHHCGYGEIQAHSSIENNYLRDGFWAKSNSEELANPGLSVTFIDRIDDVTNKILEGTHSYVDNYKRDSVISTNISKLIASYKLNEFQSVTVEKFFKGNQFFAFTKTTFNDVRLVGAPPSMIGKFGSDTDNWVWPRHTGDFSLFRVYASKDNKPANYSPENIPYRPKYFLPISLDGIEEGDFTMVYGFPGRTDEYLPAVAIDQIVKVINPNTIGVRDVSLSILNQEMRASEEINIKYASKYAGIANSWKKWIGESKGLIASKAVEKRKNYEKEFSARIAKNPKSKNLYQHILPEFDKLYQDYEVYNLANKMFIELMRNVEIISISSGISPLVGSMSNMEQDRERYYSDIKPNILAYFDNFYKDYEPKVDKKVFASILKIYIESIDKDFLSKDLLFFIDRYKADYQAMANAIFDESYIPNANKFREMLSSNNAEGFVQKLSADPAIQLTNQIINSYKTLVEPKYRKLSLEISDLQRIYMKAQMEAFSERAFYPDANSTLRITWGKVDGYEPMDGVYYSPKTYLDGVIEKHKDGDYEFDVPQKLRQLYEDKDYGIYGENGKLPVAFIATNHTTGGNSGSPALDAYGNLIGLNFDRVWEGTMSDINYDAAICRNIMVDIKYVLFIIDKYGDSRYLLDEMKLIRPKYHAKLNINKKK